MPVSQISLMFISSLWDVKEPTHYSRRVGDEVPGVVAVLRECMGGWAEQVPISCIAANTSTCSNKEITNKQTNIPITIEISCTILLREWLFLYPSEKSEYHHVFPQFLFADSKLNYLLPYLIRCLWMVGVKIDYVVKGVAVIHRDEVQQ